MFKVYTGAGAAKKSIEKLDNRNDAIRSAWKRQIRTGVHHGIQTEGVVIFHTNFQDSEFLEE